MDPPKQVQKAITPKLLKCLFQLAGGPPTKVTAQAQAADIIIGAFFFAARSCEYSKTPKPGKTKLITAACVVFRSGDKKIIPHNSPRLVELSEFVTITFIDQKNGDKMDARSQRRTDHPVLCPTRRWASAIRRLATTLPDFSGETPLCTIHTNGSTLLINNTFIRTLLRDTCRLYGGKPVFGFHPHEIGNKSIRSGAAMALSLLNHAPYRIQILGRWRSNSFLDYIRPQVLEWTTNMSRDMIQVTDFHDFENQNRQTTAHHNHSNRRRPLYGNDPSELLIPKFHLQH